MPESRGGGEEVERLAQLASAHYRTGEITGYSEYHIRHKTLLFSCGSIIEFPVMDSLPNSEFWFTFKGTWPKKMPMSCSGCCPQVR